ncbi:MAG: universal stress protein [Burkholderiales bacterium]
MLKVLLPMDDSSKLDQALRYIAMCERESRWPIEIHILHVEPRLSRYVAGKLPRDAVKRYHDDHSRQVLDPIAAAFTEADIPNKTHSVVGDPVESIVHYAKEAGISRIVMVTRARESLTEVLLGSVTAGVLQHATVPVEVVPIDPRSRLSVYARAAGAGATILTLVYLALE